MSAGQGIVDEALAGLVHQFADPLACFRELVQNAIDAGSTEIDIRFGHEDGRLVIDVDDYGEGMDRRIIDTKLTRLFSSSKDDDRTKIGRFGIGFVSVFALEPDVIRIDTSRAGEHWRVVFRPDRTFTRVARDEPVDGTKIRIYMAMPEPEARALAERARAVIAFWCRHVTAVLRVDGRVVSEPFDVPATCKVAAEVGEARIVAGYSRDGAGRIGYYNRGLTLLEETSDEFPGVHLKLWSPALEHTMTRDNVLRDEGYEKVMEHARRLVSGPLRAKLMEALAADVPPVHRPGEAHEHLYAALARHIMRDEALPAGARKCAFVRTLGGEPVDLTTLARARAKQRLWHASVRSPVTERLRARGDQVVAVAGPSAMLTLLGAAGAGPVAVDEAWCTAALLPAERPAGWPGLAAAVRAIAAAVQPLAGVELGSLKYPGSPVAQRVAIAQSEPGGLTRLAEAGALAQGRWLVLNADDRAVRDALELAVHEPEFAAATVLKLFWLEGQDLPVARATALALATVEVRCRRTT